MGGKQSAEWWREYRVRKAEAIRAYNRERRKNPQVRAQRKACERRRRARISASNRERQEDIVLPFCGCELYDIARRIVGPRPSPGTALVWINEVIWEDAVEEVVLALIEDRDPVLANKAYRSAEKQWERVTCPQFDEGSLSGEDHLDR